MGCFTLDWFEHLLIVLVIICVIVGIVKLLLPTVLGWFGAPPGGNAVITILGYVLWAVVAIFCIIMVFDFLSCMGTGNGFHLLR